MLCGMNTTHGKPAPVVARGWTVDDSTYGARLALIRQRMQWNIKEAARECGVPAASWGTWENGATPRKLVEISTLIAQRTGCDLGWLIAGPLMTGRAEIATPAVHDQKVVSGQLGRLDIPARATFPARRASRPSGRTSAQRRPVSVRVPGHTMPTSYAA